ncbi:MAG: heme exporter protein CcmB, partial [Gemmatimonadota bacterium]|nr:heme exporter protein CcmB [Gemmatimonadota bacterium]
MSFLGRALAILRKDLKAEWRTKARLSPMVFFILLMLLVFNFSFDLGGAALGEIGPGTLWSSYVFASLLSLSRSFADERDNDALDALLLVPGDRGAIYLGKMLGNLVFLLAVEILSLPFFALFFNLSMGFFLIPLLAVFVLGSACMASAGTLFAALSNNMRLRELMMPLLLLPMILPALISC